MKPKQIKHKTSSYPFSGAAGNISAFDNNCRNKSTDTAESNDPKHRTIVWRIGFDKLLCTWSDKKKHFNAIYSEYFRTNLQLQRNSKRDHYKSEPLS